MTGEEMFVGIVVVGLIAYLTFALIKPEVF